MRRARNAAHRHASPVRTLSRPAAVFLCGSRVSRPASTPGVRRGQLARDRRRSHTVRAYARAGPTTPARVPGARAGPHALPACPRAGPTRSGPCADLPCPHPVKVRGRGLACVSHGAQRRSGGRYRPRVPIWCPHRSTSVRASRGVSGRHVSPPDRCPHSRRRSRARLARIWPRMSVLTIVTRIDRNVGMRSNTCSSNTRSIPVMKRPKSQ